MGCGLGSVFPFLGLLAAATTEPTQPDERCAEQGQRGRLGAGCNDPSKLKVPPPAELTVMTKVNAYGVVEISAPAVPETPIKLEAERF